MFIYLKQSAIQQSVGDIPSSSTEGDSCKDMANFLLQGVAIIITEATGKNEKLEDLSFCSMDDSFPPSKTKIVISERPEIVGRWCTVHSLICQTAAGCSRRKGFKDITKVIASTGKPSVV